MGRAGFATDATATRVHTRAHAPGYPQVSGFMAFFQMILLYEQPLPPPNEAPAWLEAIACVWGVVSQAVACTAICLMFFSMLCAISLLARGSADGLARVTRWGQGPELGLGDDAVQTPPAAAPRRAAGAPALLTPMSAQTLVSVSSLSGVEKTHPAPEACPEERAWLLAPPYVAEPASFHPRARPDGRLLHKAHAEELWQSSFQPKLVLVLRCLAGVVAGLFVSLGLAACVKFHASPAARWLGLALAAAGPVCWVWAQQRLLLLVLPHVHGLHRPSPRPTAASSSSSSVMAAGRGGGGAARAAAADTPHGHEHRDTAGAHQRRASGLGMGGRRRSAGGHEGARPAPSPCAQENGHAGRALHLDFKHAGPARPAPSSPSCAQAEGARRVGEQEREGAGGADSDAAVAADRDSMHDSESTHDANAAGSDSKDASMHGAEAAGRDAKADDAQAAGRDANARFLAATRRAHRCSTVPEEEEAAAAAGVTDRPMEVEGDAYHNAEPAYHTEQPVAWVSVPPQHAGSSTGTSPLLRPVTDVSTRLQGCPSVSVPPQHAGSSLTSSTGTSPLLRPGSESGASLLLPEVMARQPAPAVGRLQGGGDESL